MVSYWFDDAIAAEAGAQPVPLAGERRCDVCVVGGGVTGLWTAIHLKEREPALDVVLIDKGLCGSGSSGRNAGFVMSWSPKIATLVALYGAQEAVRLFRASEEAVRSIGAFCRTHRIECQFRHDGWLWTATSGAQLGAWNATVEQFERLGDSPFTVLSREESQARCGSGLALAGAFDRGVATVQPAALTRGLARRARESGVEIHEDTPMLALDRSRPPAIRTPRGRIAAKSVVLALNAWAVELPEFRRSMLVVGGDAMVTRPIPERLERAGSTSAVAVSDSRLLVDWFRRTADGRLVVGKGATGFVFGGRLGTSLDGAVRRRTELEAGLRRWFPELADAPVAATWRGPVTRTRSGLPFFGHLGGHPAIVYGHGYTGNGMGPSYLAGKILSAMALGIEDEWSTSPLARRPAEVFLPPEPFRYVGARIARRAVVRKEGAEDAGRNPRALDARIARLLPASLSPVKK
ncbi:MAG: NAD(P)/FAD-dependent oxidoreductase [Alphaproteobacteria bacterium]